MGRQKIEAKKIEDKQKRMATFRKRRDGLFKKALEIHLLTGAQVHLSVIHNDTHYCLQRNSDTPPDTNLITMDYTPQRCFKTRVHVNKKQNLTDVSPKINTSNNTHSQPKAVSSILTDILKSAAASNSDNILRLRYILIHELFRRTIEKCYTYLKRNQEPRNVPKSFPVTCKSSTVSVQTCQSKENDENLEQNSNVIQQTEVPLTSYLQPVTMKLASKPTTPSSIQPPVIYSTVDADDSKHESESVASPAGRTHLPLEQHSARPKELPLRFNSTSTNQLFSPLTDLLEVLENHTRGYISPDSQHDMTPAVSHVDFTPPILSSSTSLASTSSPPTSFQSYPTDTTSQPDPDQWIDGWIGDDVADWLHAPDEAVVPMNLDAW